MKCSVRTVRKRSAGSNSDAACPGVAHAQASTPSALANSSFGRLNVTRGTRQHEAHEERREAQQSRLDEKESVRLEQRTARGQTFDPDAGEPLRELPDVGVRGAQQRVLRC